MSTHEMRAVFDMDEVLLRSPADGDLEPPLGFPYRLMFQERIYIGVPALFYFLEKEGYDVWVYSSKYRSVDDVRRFFRFYSAQITGAVTGIGQHGINTKKLKLNQSI